MGSQYIENQPLINNHHIKHPNKLHSKNPKKIAKEKSERNYIPATMIWPDKSINIKQNSQSQKLQIHKSINKKKNTFQKLQIHP